MDEFDDAAALGAAASDGLSDSEMSDAMPTGGEARAEPTTSPSDTRRRSDAQARIDAVTRARREAERERDYWRERASAGGGDDSAERGDLPDGLESTDQRSRGPAGRDVRSAASADREDDDLDFGDGAVDPAEVIAFLREQARAELIAEAEAFEAQESARGAAAVWEDRQAAFATVRPDYVEAVMGSDWACSETMADAIQDSDAGPALAYHLASHPDEAARIAALSPLGQVRALGRIEAGLTDGAATAMSISAAPAPPPSLRGAGGRFRPAPEPTISRRSTGRMARVEDVSPSGDLSLRGLAAPASSPLSRGALTLTGFPMPNLDGAASTWADLRQRGNPAKTFADLLSIDPEIGFIQRRGRNALAS